MVLEEALVVAGPRVNKLLLFQQDVGAEPLAARCSPVTRFLVPRFRKSLYLIVGCPRAAAAGNGSARRGQRRLPAGLDPFPRGGELDENTLLPDPRFLVEVDEAPGPLDHSLLVKGQPWRRERRCLTRARALTALPQTHGNHRLLSQHFYTRGRFFFSEEPPGWWGRHPGVRPLCYSQSELEETSREKGVTCPQVFHGEVNGRGAA